MEDVDLVERIRGQGVGRATVLREPVTTSARRWEKHGASPDPLPSSALRCS